MDLKERLAAEFRLRPEHASNLVDLLAEGNTIPFIARYRKEMHGACDDQVIRAFADRMTYLVNLDARKTEVRAAIEGQGKWTDALGTMLDAALTLTEVEDIYRPYRQKRKTRASVAVERGLEPLADAVWTRDMPPRDLEALAATYVNAEKGVGTPAQALAGASDILAERISDDAAVRKALRAYLAANGTLTAHAVEGVKDEKAAVYEMYADYSEAIASMPPHRVLAVNRGEKEGCLRVALTADRTTALEKIRARLPKHCASSAILRATLEDGYDRLLFPSVEREVRADLTDAAAEQAIGMFELNLKPLLMQPPLKGKVIMGLDPGYRTGCKVAVIDANGNVLAHSVIYPTHENRREESARTVRALVERCAVDVISIGNGTASKETEIFVSELLRTLPRRVAYTVVNEAGASVYSASKLGAEEFPEYDLTIRSAISIARRLQDPLAELIKIDVKSIGVGQYQHDMPQKRLTEVLDGVVEDCVNSVGVDLNTASQALLARVAGLSPAIAKNIVARRKTRPFFRRAELLDVPKLGPKTFEQCAGFLRIPDGEDVLDNTAVHPESYAAARKLLALFGHSDADVRAGNLQLQADVAARGKERVAAAIGVGVPTLDDIVTELARPGRDVRDELPPPVLHAELLDLKDLKEGMELTGTVRNVIDFGAFVDIGVHRDGLVHISQLADRYVSHPSEVVKVGDIVKVRVLSVDVAKGRISLTMKTGDPAQKSGTGSKKRPEQGQMRPDRPQSPRPQNGPRDLDSMLRALQEKFNKR